MQLGQLRKGAGLISSGNILILWNAKWTMVLIVHQVPANDQRQLSSPHETGELYGTSVPRKEPRYKKRLETPSIGSTLPNRYRTNEKKTRRLIKVDDDNLSWDGSVSSGIASPDGARSPVFPQDLSPTSDNFTLRRGYYNPSSPTRRSSGEYSPGRSSDDIFNLGDREQHPDYSRTILNTSRSYDMNEGHDDGGMDLHPAREDYPGYPKTTQNPMMEKPMFEEGSMDSGNATWYNSGESTMGDTGDIPPRRSLWTEEHGTAPDDTRVSTLGGTRHYGT
ncbi:hypothetical protein BSL78_17891 [Apostichopus japonicus]|uniref:Uncharacterized protein n=1 Tax=Stichopus japonicus TaxID=307972 RepID=A0A2G8KB70_STIJA|nr:hypothetical protein BSL78_17891 [Apostichopus japonicus]